MSKYLLMAIITTLGMMAMMHQVTYTNVAFIVKHVAIGLLFLISVLLVVFDLCRNQLVTRKAKKIPTDDTPQMGS